MKTKTNRNYDLIVIGAGAGGLNVAGFMNQAGFRVLLVDKSDHSIGGDCLNSGCVPSKSLIHVARLFHSGRAASKFGPTFSGLANLSLVRDYVYGRQDQIRRHENATWFKEQGIEVVLGTAKFVDRHTIEVEGVSYQGQNFVIATGSYPRLLNIPGSDKIKFLTNENVFNLSELPAKLLVIGGGPIGLELGQAFQFLGSQVTIIQREKQLLPKEDPEIASILEQQLRSDGLRFYLGWEPSEFLSSSKVKIKDQSGQEEELSFDKALVAIGRIPNTKSLNLEAAGVTTGAKGEIVVNDHLRTTNRRIYALGDVIGGLLFTHAAELQAAVLLRNFFSPFKKKLNFDHFSWVTYTSPEIATFGLSLSELQRRQISFETLVNDFSDDDRAIINKSSGQSKLKLYVSAGRIVGGTMVAPNAGELVQELLLANSSNLPISAIWNKVYPYPAASRINKSALKPLFIRRLTPWVKEVMHWLYWFR